MPIDPLHMEPYELASQLETALSQSIKDNHPTIKLGPRTLRRIIQFLHAIPVCKSGHRHLYKRMRHGKPYYEVRIRQHGTIQNVYSGENLEDAIQARDKYLLERDYNKRATEIEHYEEMEEAQNAG